MLNKIIKFALNNRLIVLVASVIIILAGSYTASRMEVDVFPDLNAPTVVVMTEAQGMAPEEVERIVSFPIETALNGATDVRRVRSSSTTGFSIVWVEFDWGTDEYRARQIVSEKLALASEQFPENVGNPTLGPQSSVLGEVMFVGLTADSTSMLELREIADWVIRPRLLSTGGVAQVAVLGGDVKEYQILLDPEKMRHYGVGLSEVMEVTNGMNQNASGGVLYEYGNEYIIRGMLLSTDPEAIGKTVVKPTDSAPILLENIATVQIGSKAPKTGLASISAKEGVLMTVTKQPNTSTLDLTNMLDKTIEELKKELPKDVKVDTELYRQQRFIDSSINNIQRSLVEGAIFVALVLFVFLMNPRTTLISLVTIPMAILITFLVMKAMGLTMNTMSIGGIAIAIGSLVDDAIVDVENVYKRLRQNRALPADQQLPALKVIYEASREVRMPILNSTLIIVVSFLPLFFLDGMEGRMLVPLGVAFIVSLFASTFVALTLTPVLCSFLLTKATKADKEPKIVVKMKGGYSKALEWVIARKKVVLGSVLGLFVVALGLFFTLGRSFLPPFNEGSFTINVSSMPGISLEESDNVGRQVEQILLSVPEIKRVARKTGRAELDEHSFGVNVSEIEAPFELDDRSKDEVVAELRDKLSELSGVNIEIGQPISHRIDAMLSGTRANVAIKIFGSDLNKMYAIGNKIKDAIQGVEGVADLNVEQQVERPQLKIEPRREVLARYGITLPQFAEYVNVLLGGEVVSNVFEGNRSFDLTVKVKDESRSSIDNIRNLMIETADGSKIPFEYVADIRSSSGPNTISRENVSRKLVVSANVSGRDLRGAVNDIQEIIDEQITLPDDYHIEYGGQFESEQAASQTLMITSIFSILAIYLLLYNQFRSPSQAAVIMLNLPLALIGGVFVIFFTSGVVSIPSIIGFISLFGIATRNGMLLVDRYNDLVAGGMSVKEAVIHGSLDRLNPIVMTALTSALALIPLALGGALPGNEIQSPMAQVILGGLLSSTLLNGFVIPIIYLMMNKKTNTSVEL
ncbi:MAG: efflux RND transporter permease subunit [Muribaculaceae bacterium]|nr:efflux RND transporter permease subunit [Muribaculaceae bacterium]